MSENKVRKFQTCAMEEMNLGKSVRGTLLVFIDLLGLVSSGTWGLIVPVLVGGVVLFDLGVDWMWCADLKFKGLNLSVNVVLATVGGGGLVDEVEKDDDKDESRGKGIEHERGRVAR
jgi:hypothetical protein